MKKYVCYLQEGKNEFVIKDYHGELRSFDASVEMILEDTIEGLKVIIHNYSSEKYVLGFTQK